MAKEHLEHIEREMTAEERQLAQAIREGAMQDFPPKDVEERVPPPGIPLQIYNARKQRSVTRYELGKVANVPSTVVRAIELGEDVPLSQLQAVAGALGLSLELVVQA